ncbi:hypothetical protein BCR42DRAFT_154870 [Absidia repens]|uniref:F-box domain-containing protein n=1 Tax=Absidia repens TaxID=90262 RepID=A0A1X2I1C7_9FUNG|nr:hypothetical protein BCR42DRAFT_154870 [Absidia repens]
MTSLGSLPLELIPLIIKQVHDQRDLYACALISKLFYATASPILWQSLTIPNKASLTTINNTLRTNKPPPPPPPSLCHAFLGHNIRHVDFCFPLTRAEFLAFIQHTVRLESLGINLALIQPDRTITKHLEHHFSHLRTLHLKNCNMSPHMCHMLRQHCLQLGELSLVDCTGLSPRLVGAWMACPSLKCITVEGGNMDLEEDNHTPPRGSVVAAAAEDSQQMQRSPLDVSHEEKQQQQQQQQHSLDRLSLIAPRISFLDLVLTMDNMDPIWSQLTCLHLATCHNVNEAMLWAFFQSHGRLTSIVFEGYSITDTSLHAMGMFLSTCLEKVHLIKCGRITHHGVRRLVQCCLKMTRFQLDQCGILASRFPEAQLQHCIASSSRLGALYVRSLDHKAIQKIHHQQGWDTDTHLKKNNQQSHRKEEHHSKTTNEPMDE